MFLNNKNPIDEHKIMWNESTHLVICQTENYFTSKQILPPHLLIVRLLKTWMRAGKWVSTITLFSNMEKFWQILYLWNSENLFLNWLWLFNSFEFDDDGEPINNVNILENFKDIVNVLSIHTQEYQLPIFNKFFLLHKNIYIKNGLFITNLFKWLNYFLIMSSTSQYNMVNNDYNYYEFSNLAFYVTNLTSAYKQKILFNLSFTIIDFFEDEESEDEDGLEDFEEKFIIPNNNTLIENIDINVNFFNTYKSKYTLFSIDMPVYHLIDNFLTDVTSTKLNILQDYYSYNRISIHTLDTLPNFILNLNNKQIIDYYDYNYYSSNDNSMGEIGSYNIQPALVSFLSSNDNNNNIFWYIARLIPQIFQVKVISLVRKLRKILKNKRRYKKKIVYIKSYKRNTVLGSYLYLFFKFSCQKKYIDRIMHSLLILLFFPEISPAFLIYNRLQIDGLSEFAKKSVFLC